MIAHEAAVLADCRAIKPVHSGKTGYRPKHAGKMGNAKTVFCRISIT